MISTPSYLKQARKLVDLSLIDMAYIINIDVSNLSKYERGKLNPTLHVLIAYHIVTKTSLSRLFQSSVEDIRSDICERIKNLIEHLERETPSRSIQSRIDSLGVVLQNSSNLIHEQV